MPTCNSRRLLLLSAAALVSACAPVLVSRTIRQGDAAISPPAASAPVIADSANDLSASDATAAVPAAEQQDGDDPVGHVIVFPLLILAAVVLIGATVGIIGLVTGHR